MSRMWKWQDLDTDSDQINSVLQSNTELIWSESFIDEAKIASRETDWDDIIAER